MAKPTPSPFHSRAALLLCGSALLLASPALAQVTVDDARTAPVRTSTAGTDGTADDVTISGTGSVTIETPGPAVVLDSDNTLTNAGSITIQDVDGATGVELQGGADRSFTNSGTITVGEVLENANTDDDPIFDQPFAEGTGRRGILVSGASPFEGNITLDEASRILVQGNQSYGVDLANTPVGAGLEGSLSHRGSIALAGNEGAGIRIASGVTGNVINEGSIDVRGTGSNALDVGASIAGGLSSSGRISNSGFRFDERVVGFNPDSTFDITDLDAEDLGNAGAAIRVSADIDQGIELGRRFATIELDDGTTVEQLVAVSTISQFGSAPAVLIDGAGTPIAIGRVGQITDPDADGFDEDLQYAFVHQGQLVSSGVFNDFDATVLRVADATLDGGILNSGTMNATAITSVTRREIEGVELGTGLARVIVLGDGAIAERINNTGVILAQAQEDADEAFFDPDNIIPPAALEAIAIDVEAGGNLASFENNGSVSALLVGRDGTATVVRDASGTLSNIVNRGILSARASTSDPDDEADTRFTLIALDLSANTDGVTFLQERLTDENPDDDIVPLEPLLFGEVRLGSGDDALTINSGAVLGDIDFGGGTDRLVLNDAVYAGEITGSDDLSIDVSNGGVLGLAGNAPVSVASATFDDTAAFRPTIDGATGSASTLQATGAISFAAGATVTPVLSNLINSDTINSAAGTDFTIASASDLSIGDLAALNAGDDGSFLFDTAFNQVGDTLVVTVDLRQAADLGLDPTQTGVAESVYGATLQALQNNGTLGNEIANLGTADEFYAAYNQLLPEFAAASRQFVLANTDGAVGAVANHLDAARRSPDKPGGAWLQEFAYFADRDLAGLSEQYRGEGFGFAGGLDTALGPFHAVGLNFGFASTEIEDVVGVDQPLDVVTLIAGLYAGYATGNLGIDAYVGGGLNQFEQNRRIAVGDFRGESLADWDGTHLNASLRAGYDIELSERFWARPVVSVDYLRLSEDAYSESGDIGVALNVAERTSELGSVSGLLNFGATFNGKRTWIRPSIRVGYRNEFISDPVMTSFNFAGIDNALAAQTLSADFPNSGVLLGFSVAAGSGFSSVGFDFDSDIRDGFIRHTGRIVVRLLF